MKKDVYNALTHLKSAASSCPTSSEPDSTENRLSKTVKPGQEKIQVVLESRNSSKPVSLLPCPTSSDFSLILQLKGCCVVSGPNCKPSGLAPNSAGIVFERDSCELTAGRGEYLQVILMWNAADLSALLPTLEVFHANKKKAAVTTSLPASPTSLNDECEKLLGFSSDFSKTPDSILVSLISLSLSVIDSVQECPRLAIIPPEAHGPLRDLLEEIVTFPEKQWSLKDAASQASYSAFYLSRMFRSISDYGFPEFVDRARTQKAVEMLLDSTKSIQEVIDLCGFSSIQRLRNACRDYCGFLPSELQRFSKN